MKNDYWPLIRELAATYRNGAAIKPRTVEKWKERRSVPHKYRLLFLAMARAKKKRLPESAFEW